MYIFESSNPRLIDAWNKIKDYCQQIETGESDTVCFCTWKMIETPTRGLKKVIDDINLTCPVHTKEGFLLGYICYMRPAFKEFMETTLKTEDQLHIGKEVPDELPAEIVDEIKLKVRGVDFPDTGLNYLND